VWNTLPVIQGVYLYPVEVIVSDFESSGLEAFPSVSICPNGKIDCITLTRAYLQNKKELKNLMNLSYCAILLGRRMSLLKEVCSLIDVSKSFRQRKFT